MRLLVCSMLVSKFVAFFSKSETSVVVCVCVICAISPNNSCSSCSVVFCSGEDEEGGGESGEGSEEGIWENMVESAIPGGSREVERVVRGEGEAGRVETEGEGEGARGDCRFGMFSCSNSIGLMLGSIWERSSTAFMFISTVDIGQKNSLSKKENKTKKRVSYGENGKR